MNDTAAATAPSGTPSADDTPAAGRPAYKDPRQVAFYCVVALAVIGSMIHQAGPQVRWDGWTIENWNWRLWPWYIEDAAISFAYARNWAEGDGLVAFRGGERIEGYSNPLWVALMALWYHVGVDGFDSSKWMGMFFGGTTVVFTWLAAREALDDRDSPATLVAPVFLAIFPPFAFWNASGLENSLFCFMLSGGIWRTLVEARKGGFPYASLFFLGLAVTRPEGILYGAWGGFVAMVASLMAGRGLKRTVQWLLTFFVPFTIYHAIRYNYFAWAFPNTYYAKLGAKTFRPFAWAARGWKYIRGFGFDTGAGWFIPLFVAGLVGLRRTRVIVVAAASLLYAMFFLYPDAEITQGWSWWPEELPSPASWNEARVWGLFALSLLLPVTALKSPGSTGRVLSWGMAFITLFFCVKATGDWMNGYRWMSFLSAPAAILFAAGVEQTAGFFQRHVRTLLRLAPTPEWRTTAWLVGTALTLAAMPGFFSHSNWFFKKRETGPFSVKKRVEYTAGVTDRLGLEGLIRNLDVDMGAHLYWSEHQMVDMAGLVDITISQHNYRQRAVTREYVFDEMKPSVAHVHGGWANSSKIPTFSEWKNGYVEIPGFPVSSRTNHMGNHIRRDTIMKNVWPGPSDRRVPFAGNFVLHGYKTPSPEISVGKSTYVEVGLQYRATEDKTKARLIGFLSNEQGALHSFDMPLGYDWLPTDEWRPDEVFVGWYDPIVDKELAPGTYDLGFLLLAGDGSVLPAGEIAGEDGPVQVDLPDGAVVGGREGVAPRLAAGELRFEDVIEIGPPGTGERAARADFDRAMSHATEDRCKQAEIFWRLARRHIPRAERWHDKNGEIFADAVATCWVERAAKTTDPHAAAQILQTARAWNHRLPALWEVQEEVGERLYEEGMVARLAEDWGTAYAAFRDAVIANPSLSWARRYAEEARDHRFGLDPETQAQKEREREERLEQMRERQQEAQQRRDAVEARKDDPPGRKGRSDDEGDDEGGDGPQPDEG